MKIGLIQTKQNLLYDFGNPDLCLEKSRAIELQTEMIDQTILLIKEAAKLGCEFIVTTEAINFAGSPTCVNCDYSQLIPKNEEPLFQQLKNLAKESNAYLIAGVYNQRNNKFYNSAFVYDKEGEQIATYDKIHLAGNENDYLTSGDQYLVLNTEYGKIGIAICWDMQFPEVSRELVLRDADLIVCPTWGWEQIYAHARAYENGIYVAGVMAVPFRGEIEGIRNPSEVIAPTGEIIASGSRVAAQVVVCDIDIKECKEYKELRVSNRHPDTYQIIGIQK